MDTEESRGSRRRRRLAAAGAVLFAVAVVVTVLVLRPWSSPAGGPAAGRLTAAADTGRVVALTGSQDLVVSRPDGTHTERFPALTQVGSDMTAAADNRYISLGDGRIVSTAGPRLAMAKTRIYPFVGGMQGVFGSWPFSDHDRQLLAIASGQDLYTDNRILEYSLATGKSRSLGIADVASGDPQTPGAFVTVGSTKDTPANAVAAQQGKFLPDSKAELRIPGKRPRLLASAATLAHDAGLPAGSKVSLGPYPSTFGDMVAFSVEGAATRRTGIVILSRSGTLTAALPPSVDADGEPAWSPSGTTLAIPSSAQGGRHVLALWTAGHPVRTEPFPAGIIYRTCIWSADGKRVLCAGTPQRANITAASTKWAIASVSGGPMTQVTGPGTPVAWLP
jgi:hypothetical protein